MHEVTVLIVLAYFFADHFLHAVHFERRQKFTIGHGFNTIFITTYPDKLFYMRIPGCYIFITDGPGDAVAKAFGIDKLILTPALTSPSPGERFAPHLVSPYPIKGFFLYVGVIFIFHKKMRVILAITCRFGD